MPPFYLEIEMTETTEVVTDLEVMIPAPRTVTVGREQVTIPPLKVKQLTQVLKLSKPLVPSLSAMGKGNADIAALVVDFPDQVVAIVAVLLNREVAWVEELEVDSLVDLATAVVEVNLDFFIQKVLPSVLKAMAGLASATNTAKDNGLVPSKS